jgi:acyl-CoA-binding protein
MSEKDLDTRFQEAVEIAETIPQASLPQDLQLRLYAYYKQATSETISSQRLTNFDLRSAFKTNALMQISHLTTDEAKELYIENILSVYNKK